MKFLQSLGNYESSYVPLFGRLMQISWKSLDKQRKSYKIACWNNHVKIFYVRSRHAFVLWKTNGSPGKCPIAQNMRETRATFKTAMEICWLIVDDSWNKNKFEEALETSRKNNITPVTFSQVKDCIREVLLN